MADTILRPGDRVLVRDAGGEWHEAVADSEVELEREVDTRTGRYRKLHDFPVIWVRFRPGGERMPWPAEDVKLTEA
jgi:hypothetical protein